MKREVKVVQQSSAPEIPTEVIAQHISRMSEAMKKLMEGRLNHNTIVLLLHDSSKVSRRDIVKVLDALMDLEKTYLKPEKKK